MVFRIDGPQAEAVRDRIIEQLKRFGVLEQYEYWTFVVNGKVQVLHVQGDTLTWVEPTNVVQLPSISAVWNISEHLLIAITEHGDCIAYMDDVSVVAAVNGNVI